MFKGSQSSAAKYDNEKQKQKKKLSFKDPEVEVGCSREKCVNSSFKKCSENAFCSRNEIEEERLRKHKTSLEDLNLEDQALEIARSVGEAFLSPASIRPKPKKPDCLFTIDRTKQITTGNPHKDRYSNENLFETREHKNSESSTKENPGFLDSLAPPVLNSSRMRYPPLESGKETHSSVMDSSSSSSTSDKPSINSEYQVQLLRYQLEQQNQQTKTALQHVQLLKDQLEAEGTTRYKAQVQNQELMKQNQDLLDHIQRLFLQIQDLEKQVEKHKKNTSGNETACEPHSAPTSTVGLRSAYRRNSSEALSLCSYRLSANSAYSISGRRSSITNPKVNLPSPTETHKKQLAVQQHAGDDSQNKVSNTLEFDWRLKFQDSSLWNSSPRSSFSLVKKQNGDLNLSEEMNKNTNTTLCITNSEEKTKNANQSASQGADKQNDNNYAAGKSLVIEELDSESYSSTKEAKQNSNNSNTKKHSYPQSNIRWHQYDNSSKTKSNTSDLKIT